MRILIGLDALRPPLTGIGYYTMHLVREMIRMPGMSIAGLTSSGMLSGEALASLTDSPGRPAPAPVRQRLSFLRELPAAYPLFKAMNRQRMTHHLRQAPEMDLYHEPGFIACPFSGKTVITIHDLSHLRHPETHPPARVAWLGKKLPESIAQASAIITDCDAIRQELLDFQLVREEKLVHAVPLGYEAGFRPRSREEVRPVLTRLGLGWRRFILGVATLEPRKNTLGLIRAYLSLPPETIREVPLVLAGAEGWKNGPLKTLLRTVKSPHRVLLTGYLPRQEIQALMASAALFAYPSLYEGFGLPVLEAMASDVPVLTSDRDALAELVADAALTVPPENGEALREGLRTLLEKTSIGEGFRRKGLERAAAFSWRRCAVRTAEIYQEARG